MNSDNNPVMHADDRLLEQAGRCTDALKALQPKQQHQKAQLFALLYPTIVELLNKQVSQKAILEVLETQGLKLHPARFKELMAAQAATTHTSSTDKAL
ncbi:MAG: hypothetical protein DI584_12880 [Stenotrophomonas sp.]|jgi:hypothetical protein|nr:MAG: hypothetical protein DI584_12880 [Stenotrophomonas sp.]